MSSTKLAPANAQRHTLQDTTDYLKMLYQGEPGSGKTTAAAHMAKLGKVVWVLAESGLKDGPIRRLGVPTGNIEIHPTISYKALDELYGDLRGTLHADPDAYTGVVFDSLTELQGKLLESRINEPRAYTQPEYNVNTQELTMLLRHFCDLTCHVVFTAHLKREQDSDGEVNYRPATTPGVANRLLGYVDMTCVTLAEMRPGSDEPDYTGLFRPNGKLRGKDRFNVTPPKLYNPTFDRIAAYVDGTYRREAQREADAGTEIPNGLDPEQYEYRMRVAAARAKQTEKENAA